LNSSHVPHTTFGCESLLISASLQASASPPILNNANNILLLLVNCAPITPGDMKYRSSIINHPFAFCDLFVNSMGFGNLKLSGCCAAAITICCGGPGGGFGGGGGSGKKNGCIGC
jgi:hypothetical protein